MRGQNDSKQLDTKQLDNHIAGIDAELDLEPERRTSLDVQGLVEARDADLVEPARDAKPRLRTLDDAGNPKADASLGGRMDGYIQVALTVLGALRDAKKRHEAAASAARRYTAEAYDEARTTHATFTAIRERINKRIPSTKVGKELREACGVGANVPDDAPANIARRATSMLEALENPAYAELFGVTDVDAKLLARQLKKPLAALSSALDKTPAADRKGEVAPELQRAALRVDVAFQRLVAFLEDHGARQEAAAINGRLPRRLQRRATDAKEPVGPEVVVAGPGVVGPVDG